MNRPSTSNYDTPAHVRGEVSTGRNRLSDRAKRNIGAAAVAGLFTATAILTGINGFGSDSRTAHTGNPDATAPMDQSPGYKTATGEMSGLAQLAPGTTEAHAEKGKTHLVPAEVVDEKTGKTFHESPWTVAKDLRDSEGNPLDVSSDKFEKAVIFLKDQIKEGEAGFLPSQQIELPVGYTDIRDPEPQPQPGE